MGYCTHCGQGLIRTWQEEDGRYREVCGSCHEVHYDSPKVLVVCLVQWESRLLLSRRAAEPAKGCWYLPTGFVEAGETADEAAVRELREEVGLELPSARMILYGVVNLPLMNQVYIAYRTRLAIPPSLRPGPESQALRWFGESDLGRIPLAFDASSHGFVKDFFTCMRLGRFPVQAVTFGRAAPALEAPGR